MFRAVSGLIRKVFPSLFKSKAGDDPNRAVILCGPLYDEVTRHTCAWLEGVRIPSGVTTYSLFRGDANREQVVRCLEQTTTSKRVKIFFGHGQRKALLGEPSSEGNNIEYAGKKHGVIYDESLISPVPSSLFAFSCEVGLELGRTFCSTEGRNFLGYSEVIPIEVSNEECEKAWERIVQTISSEIIEDGEILPVHETRLRDLYHQAILYFHQYEGKDNDRALLMMMYLLHHQKSLRLYRGVA